MNETLSSLISYSDVHSISFPFQSLSVGVIISMYNVWYLDVIHVSDHNLIIIITIIEL